MNKFVVIGLGNFGMNISRVLMSNDAEVLGIDSEKNTVQKAKDVLTLAIHGDASNRAVIEALSLKDFDGAIVSIGQEMAASILISLYLKEIGIPRIVVRAISEDHAKVLTTLGITDIVFPEKDMAERIGMMLSMKNTLDYLPLTEDYAIMEVGPPASFVGKAIRDLAIGARFGCQVLGIKYPVPPGSAEKPVTKIAPSASDQIPAGGVMIILGRREDIAKIQILD